MNKKTIVCCLIIGIFSIPYTVNAEDDTTTKELKKTLEPTNDNKPIEEKKNDTSKDKRQISLNDTPVYPNHRTESIADDDPEVAQETIYGTKPNQFIIRAVSPHHHQQHEEHQEPQLRNYPTTAPNEATQRSHNTQLLEQSQEVQHFAYLQDLSRHHPKVSSTSNQAKSRAAQAKKAATTRAQLQYSKPEEAEQRYAVAIQAPVPVPLPHIQPQPRQFHQHPSAYQTQPQQPQQQQHPQQYQIIPEEHFLKLIEQELQARAYQDEQIRQQQHQQQAAAHAQGYAISGGSNKLQPSSDRSIKGLGSYRQHAIPSQSTPNVVSPTEAEPTAPLPPTPPAYVQYVPRHRGGPKYLPLPSQAQQQQHQQHQQQLQQQLQQQQQQAAEADVQDVQQPELPPQIAYYQPQVSYKTLPNHPLAKSSLEKEIEKLFSTNRPASGAVQIVDSSNEPSAVVNHHYQPQPQPQPQPQTQAIRSPKTYISNTTPNSLLDANNQPFIPSLFRFSNFQTPTPIYPTQVPQQIIDAKKLGPVVYPTQPPQTTAQPAQQSQYYYQETDPSPKPKIYRPKQYDIKLLQDNQLGLKREKSIKIQAAPKYTQPLVYDFNTPVPRAQSSPPQFYPSPPDPNNGEQLSPQSVHPTQAGPPPTDFRQFVLPAPAPSQSSIFVSQGTGITTPSRPAPQHKPKTIEDVKQLRLPQPGGKPLTQAEFQALIEAGYPLTAVPVPVPVPYAQYIKDHPEYRNQPLDYAQIMRNAQQQYAARPTSRLAVASEPNVKIVSSATEQQTATAIGGGSVTYLRPIHSGANNQRRHPRDNDKETKVTGETTKSNSKEKN